MFYSCFCYESHNKKANRSKIKELIKKRMMKQCKLVKEEDGGEALTIANLSNEGSHHSCFTVICNVNNSYLCPTRVCSLCSSDEGRDSGNDHFVPQIVGHFHAVSVYLMVVSSFLSQKFPETFGHEI